jgi:hypothetical protein
VKRTNVGNPRLGGTVVLSTGALVGLALIGSCSRTPAAPTSQPSGAPPIAESPAPPVPPPPAPSPSATLAVEHASVHSDGTSVRFLLRETSGRSGATIDKVLVVGPNGGFDTYDRGCWQDRLRVPPGGTLDTFFADAGVAWLAYCAPRWGDGTTIPFFRIVVTFLDDDGIVGTAEAVVNVTHQALLTNQSALRDRRRPATGRRA